MGSNIAKVKYLLLQDMYNTNTTVLKMQKDTDLQLGFYTGAGFTYQ